LDPAEICPGVTFEALDLRAPLLSPVIESAIRQETRERVLEAIGQLAQEIGLGATVREISSRTKLHPRRIREVLERELQAGAVSKSAGQAIPPEHQERTAHAYLWSLT
jgi:hypothetical protein